ncbi:aspartyl-tRNA(Asn)/glutamyl-tRNA(Gln) amidotransferase subunit A [Amycolatopsis bartoniae]|uniref:Amidase n=1 Tax=Amycolatopsis bartoniae TaxID=941986 RepID=A0A8H9ISC3_9PSEU|nr:amidase [Amycolatopsis bartoniae]MBB2937728.1 aspartyl-tRNA(Asn)/glutamyl-tRNA(Gln) amidotransferase subunit A [Amycolatopsis bartoniae]GHF40253.1 amidase [Amycolatopsis bartoniae]
MPELTLAAAAEALRTRQLSPVELTGSVLARLDEVEPRLNAYAAVAAEQARKSAREAEREIAAGHYRGPLHGIPFGLKDLIDAEGLPIAAGSRVRAGHRAAADSAVAARLRAAGAVLVGKTHTHEFGYGLITPQTVNARDAGRVAGGSSGGSAVAVAAGTALFALGTDTGGSIRVPAALNGVAGLKPTYGLLSRRGVVPLSWSLDHVGPLARTVEDIAIVLSGLTSSTVDEAGVAGLRVGVPRNYYFERVHPEVETAVLAAVDRLASLGARPVEVEIPMTRYVQAIQWGLMVSEATAYHEPTLRTSAELYAPDVRLLLEAGKVVSATDYLRARRARTLFRREWLRLLEDVDLIAAPTVPMTAVPIGQETVTWPDGVEESVSDAYVRLSAPANLAGVPSLTVPVGRDSAGLPIGMQLLGRPHGEAVLLGAGHAYEVTSRAG